jgi:hypothetical protein
MEVLSEAADDERLHICMCAHKIDSSKICIAMLMYNTVAQGGHFGLFGKSAEERQKPGVDQGYSDSTKCKMQISQETFLGLSRLK